VSEKTKTNQKQKKKTVNKLFCPLSLDYGFITENCPNGIRHIDGSVGRLTVEKGYMMSLQ